MAVSIRRLVQSYTHCHLALKKKLNYFETALIFFVLIDCNLSLFQELKITGHKSSTVFYHYQTLDLMTSKDFITDLRRRVGMVSRTSNNSTKYGGRYFMRSDHGTINIVVLAPNGDAACATSTINTLFGSLMASTSTGIILNNEMDDFCAPDIVNSFGLPPSPINFIDGGKRPLSSSCPSIITGPNKDVRLVIGAAGGTHITSATAQAIINNLWLNQRIKQAVDTPRVHHQLLPMVLKYEYGFPKTIIDGLEKAGHKVRRQLPHSCVTAIEQINSEIRAIYDYRRGGSTAGI